MHNLTCGGLAQPVAHGQDSKMAVWIMQRCLLGRMVSSIQSSKSTQYTLFILQLQPPFARPIQPQVVHLHLQFSGSATVSHVASYIAAKLLMLVSVDYAVSGSYCDHVCGRKAKPGTYTMFVCMRQSPLEGIPQHSRTWIFNTVMI